MPFNSNYFNDNRKFFKVYEDITKEAFRKKIHIIGKTAVDASGYTDIMVFEPQNNIDIQSDSGGIYYAPFGWGGMLPMIKVSLDVEFFKAEKIPPYYNEESGYYGYLGGVNPFVGGYAVMEEDLSQDHSETFCSNMNEFAMWVPFCCIIPRADIPELEIKYYNNADTELMYGQVSLVTKKTVYDLKVGNAYYYHLKNGELVLDDIVKVQVKDFTSN